MKKLLGALVILSSMSLAASASADVAPDPCDGKSAGDDCTTYDDQAGTCQLEASVLTCVPTSSTTTTTSSSTTTGSGGGGEGGDGSGGGASGSSEDDGGCSVAAVGAPVAAGSMSLLGLAVIAGVRLAGRRRKSS